MRTKSKKAISDTEFFPFTIGMIQLVKRFIFPALILGAILTSCGTYKSRIAWTNGPAGSQTLNVHSIPIIKLNKLILIKGQANGVFGYFILDTGAPGLVLNEAYFNGHGISPKRMVTGVNGQVHEAMMTEVYDLKLGEVRFTYQLADVIDLSHIERLRKVKILGLLGVNLFKGVELEIDVQKHRMRIFKVNKEGGRINGPNAGSNPELISMPFTFSGHLIELEAKINNKPCRIAFDSGSEVLLLDKNMVDKEHIYTGLLSNQTLLSTDGEQPTVEVRKLDSILVGLNLKNIKTVLTDFNKMRSLSFRVNGLIGYDLMAAGVITINLNTRVLRIAPYNVDPNTPVAQAFISESKLPLRSVATRATEDGPTVPRVESSNFDSHNRF